MVDSLLLQDVAIAFHTVAALVLIGTGVVKLITPDPAIGLIRGLGLPARSWGARLIGCLELAIGCFALVVGGTLAVIAVSMIYMMFALVVLRARVRGVPSCGCFGQISAPPSWIHFVGNTLLATVSLSIVGARRSPSDLVIGLADDDLMSAASLVLIIGLLAGLSIVLFTALPEVIQARSKLRPRFDMVRTRVGLSGSDHDHARRQP